MKRLATMAELRGAQPPSGDALRSLASSLSGFAQSAVERACQKLENAPVASYEPRMPTLATLMETCRECARADVTHSRYCGRCRDGVIRGSDNDYHYCECVCMDCKNSGWRTFTKTVKGYSVPISFAERCPCGRKAA